MNVLMHAAAGSVNLVLCQWANHLGANVISTVGSKDKADVARAGGCHHTILYRDEDFVARVKEITAGKLPAATWSEGGIGKATFPRVDRVHPAARHISSVSAAPRSVRRLRYQHAVPRLVVLLHPSDTLKSYAAGRTSFAGDGRGPVRGRRQQRRKDCDQSDLSAQRRAIDAPRSGKPRHHGFDHPDPVKNPRMKIWGYWTTLGWAVLAFFFGQIVGLAATVLLLDMDLRAVWRHGV